MQPQITFTVSGSDPRPDTLIARAINTTIQDGDMIMAAFAMQYQGYIATGEYPFVRGKASDGQRKFLSALFEAGNLQLGLPCRSNHAAVT